jgi:hypothetical protein
MKGSKACLNGPIATKIYWIGSPAGKRDGCHEANMTLIGIGNHSLLGYSVRR